MKLIDPGTAVFARLIGRQVGEKLPTLTIGSGQPETLENRFQKQLDDLEERALGGDMRAKELWFDHYQGIVSEQKFNIDVRIVPYTIEDKSLVEIITQADRVIVGDMLKGLLTRFAMDEAPEELREALKKLIRDFGAWSDGAYAPKGSSY